MDYLHIAKENGILLVQSHFDGTKFGHFSVFIYTEKFGFEDATGFFIRNFPKFRSKEKMTYGGLRKFILIQTQGQCPIPDFSYITGIEQNKIKRKVVR